MPEITIETIGTAIGGAAGALGVAYAWWLKNQRDRSNTRAVVAESTSDRVVSEAQTAVYTLLTSRMKTLEDEVAAMRIELAGERKHVRKLTHHIWTLEGLMHAAGLKPPPFDESDRN